MKVNSLQYQNDMQTIIDTSKMYAKFIVDEYINNSPLHGNSRTSFNDDDFAKCLGLTSSGVLNILSKPYKYYMSRYVNAEGLEKLVMFYCYDAVKEIFNNERTNDRMVYIQDRNNKAYSRDIAKITRDIKTRMGEGTKATLGRGFNNADLELHGNSIEDVAEKIYYSHQHELSGMSTDKYDDIINDGVSDILPEIVELTTMSQSNGLNKDLEYRAYYEKLFSKK
jgi:hypothetical protein